MTMGKGFIALLTAVGATTYIYNKFMKTTGSLTQRSMIAAGVAGIAIFLVLYLLLGRLGF